MSKKSLRQRVVIYLYGDEVKKFHKMRQYEKDGMILLKDMTETVKSKLFKT